MASQKTHSRGPRVSTVGARFKLVLDRLFEGNQSRMAAAMDCSQPMISRIVSGKQEAGLQAVSKLASLAQLNPDWVYTGEGIPFRSRQAPKKARATSHVLPVTRDPLWTTPAQSGPALSGETFPVAAENFAATCYWLEVARNSDFTPNKRELLALRERDLLLIETDPGVLGIEHHVVDSLCLVEASKTQIRLARVSYEFEEGFDGPTAIIANFFSPTEQELAAMDRNKRLGKKDSTFAPISMMPVTLEKIRGIVIQLVRRTVLQ